MNTRISDIVIISDVDGTLIHRGEHIPQRNFAALERFVAKGGHFGIATGRSSAYTYDLAERLPVNMPCILFNGGAVMDLETRTPLYQKFLPVKAREHLQ